MIVIWVIDLVFSEIEKGLQIKTTSKEFRYFVEKKADQTKPSHWNSSFVKKFEIKLPEM